MFNVPAYVWVVRQDILWAAGFVSAHMGSVQMNLLPRMLKLHTRSVDIPAVVGLYVKTQMT